VARWWTGFDKALPPPRHGRLWPFRQAMANRQNKTGRSRTEPFLKLTWFMLESAAWRALTPAARATYIELAKLYNGRNNGWLALSVRDAAERCKINKDTAAKALAALQGAGFVECVIPGGFSRKVRHATEWRLTGERCDKTGALPSKAFMRWRPPPPSQCRTRSQSRVETVPSNGTVTPFPAARRA